MFEQSFLHTRPRVQPISLLTSLTGQLILIGATFSVPLLFPAKLQRLTIAIPQILTPPPPTAAAHAFGRSSAPARTEVHTFEAPRAISRGAPAVSDTPAVLPGPELAIPGGVPGGIEEATSLGTLTRIAASPPPQKQTPSRPALLDSPMAVGGHVQEAKLLHRVVPIYPPLARAARVSGVVRLVGVIAPDGTVRNLHVVSGHPLLVAAALAAVRQWVYRPTVLNGKPVEVLCPIEVRFNLD